MEAEPKLVSIVLVNWNGWADTVACVESCSALSYPRFDLLVIDNGSIDGSAEKIRERCPGVEVIETGTNLGFAGGNNVGIACALKRDAGFVWLLNNDTVVEAETLSALVDALERDASAGIAGSKIYFFDRPDMLWFAGGTISGTWGWTRHIGEGEVDTGQHDEPGDIDYATGASMLIRREVIDAIGPMSEEYFLYWEETDYCERARTAGWRSVYAPTSRVWHKVGASMDDAQAPMKSRYEGRNRVMFHQRNRGAFKALIVAKLAFVNAVYLALKGRPAAGAAMARGVVDAYRGRTGKIEGP